jgi:hypothetical protein
MHAHMHTHTYLMKRCSYKVRRGENGIIPKETDTEKQKRWNK